MISPKNILIVRTDRIGDVILSLPMAAIIKSTIPDSNITFLLKDYTRALAEHNSFIDNTITLKEKDGKISLRENISLLRNKFDACVVAFPTFRIALILFLAGIKIRIGSGYRWYSFLFNRKVYEHRKYGERHELELNVRLLQQIGIDMQVSRSNVQFGLNTDPETKEKIKNDLSSLGVDLTKPIIVFHPGSGGSAIDLPIEKMKRLIEKVSTETKYVVLITGSRSEEELCKSMVVNSKIINMAGKYNLSELIALIDNIKIMVANSTGPIHIAAALGKHVIGFYPKFAAVSPKRWGPYSERSNIFQPNICDGDCTREKCKRVNCMNSIDVDEVFTIIKQVILN